MANSDHPSYSELAEYKNSAPKANLRLLCYGPLGHVALVDRPRALLTTCTFTRVFDPHTHELAVTLRQLQTVRQTVREQPNLQAVLDDQYKIPSGQGLKILWAESAAVYEKWARDAARRGD